MIYFFSLTLSIVRSGWVGGVNAPLIILLLLCFQFTNPPEDQISSLSHPLLLISPIGFGQDLQPRYSLFPTPGISPPPPPHPPPPATEEKKLYPIFYISIPLPKYHLLGFYFFLYSACNLSVFHSPLSLHAYRFTWEICRDCPAQGNSDA